MEPVPEPTLTLRRELGKWDLTAIGVNQTIGSAIFILPSQVAAQIGNWSPIAFVAIGARVAARRALLRRSGQPLRKDRRTVSLYPRSLRPIRRIRGRLDAVGDARDQPGQRRERHRARPGFLLAGLYDRRWPCDHALRRSLSPWDGLTCAASGSAHWRLTSSRSPSCCRSRCSSSSDSGSSTPAASAPSGAVSLTQISTGALLLIFAFGGYDVIGVPAGEAADPRKHLPFAFVATILIVTAVMTMAQIVALGTLPNLPVVEDTACRRVAALHRRRRRAAHQCGIGCRR